MLRVVLSAVAVSMLAGAACAQPVMMLQSPYAPPPMVVVVPPPSGRVDLGGGFIEFLFGERGPAPTVVMPQQPAMPNDSRPIYINTDPAGGPGLDAPPQPFAIDPRYMRHEVEYAGKEAPGTVIIDTPNRFLFLVEPGGKAIRYGIGVGRPGFTWSGVRTVTNKREWPDWHPPEEMLKRQPELPHFVAGGPGNPLGARALYLGSTLYRIHGSNEPWTIGQMVSSGCIRLRNEDVIDLYNRVKVGTKVVVI